MTTTTNLAYESVENGERRITVIDPTCPQAAKTRMAAYARVSSDSQDQLNSYISQVRYYTDIIKENPDWEYVDIYADEGLTGLSIKKRDDFNRMMADCRKGKIDRILVKSISRFSRNITDCIDAVHELRALGVSVMFEKENLDTADMKSEFLLSLQSYRAQKESLSHAGNMQNGSVMRMRNGTFVPSSTPYGYELKNRQLSIIESEAVVVKRIFASFLAGKGVQTIADELNNENVPKNDGKVRWHNDTIRYILTNVAYIGDSLWQKKYRTETIPKRLVVNRGERDQYYVTDSHPPIISREDFAAVQSLKTERSSLIEKKPFTTYLLSKRITCEKCGTLYKRNVINGRTYWVCRKHYRNSHSCDAPPISETAIYNAFIRLYNKLRRNKDSILNPMLEQLQAVAYRKYQSNTKLNEVNNEILNLSEQVHVLDRLKSKGYMEPALCMSQIDEINRKVDALRLVKHRLMSQDDNNDTIMMTEILIDTLDKGPDWLEEMDQGLFDEIVEHITVISPELIKMRLTNGLELEEVMERTER